MLKDLHQTVKQLQCQVSDKDKDLMALGASLHSLTEQVSEDQVRDVVREARYLGMITQAMFSGEVADVADVLCSAIKDSVEAPRPFLTMVNHWLETKRFNDY